MMMIMMIKEIVLIVIIILDWGQENQEITTKPTSKNRKVHTRTSHPALYYDDTGTLIIT